MEQARIHYVSATRIAYTPAPGSLLKEKGEHAFGTSRSGGDGLGMPAFLVGQSPFPVPSWAIMPNCRKTRGYKKENLPLYI